MARHLKPYKRTMIIHMIRSTRFTAQQIADAVKCSRRAVSDIHRKLRKFGSANPIVHAGWRPTLTPLVLDALCEHLIYKPGLFIDEMVTFLWKEFNILPSHSSVQQALSKRVWTKKKLRQKAKEQSPQLRAFYQHKLSQFQSYQLVFVDESGCDKRIGCRQTGWSPLGVTPVQTSKFHRGQRYQILPAYTQDGIIISDIFQGSTDAVVFENFINRLLRHCQRYPAPRSVLVMDNASFHRSDRIKRLCSDAGVKLLYLPPYSPDFNPIEEFFAELKRYIKKVWPIYVANPDQGFRAFLRKCVHSVGERRESAEGHFRHAAITLRYM